MNVPAHPRWNGLPGRDNLLERQSESWRPPNFSQATTGGAEWMARLLRFLDLQAASIWNDLRIVLANCAGTVLDVGCGAQPYRSLLPVAVKYLGIDAADAQSHFGYQIPDTLYFEGDVWPIDSGSVDTVLATETLEHAERPERFLAEARRVLKPDGRLVLTIPFAARWHYLPHDYWRFTPSGLRTKLTEAGFDTPCIYARGNAITVACYKNMALVLMLLLGDTPPWTRIPARVAGSLLLPLLAGLALVGQASLRSRGGNDCLGYTAVATVARPAAGAT